MRISNAFIYFHWYLKRSNSETTIYQTHKWEVLNKLTLTIEHITVLMA